MKLQNKVPISALNFPRVSEIKLVQNSPAKKLSSYGDVHMFFDIFPALAKLPPSIKGEVSSLQFL